MVWGGGPLTQCARSMQQICWKLCHIRYLTSLNSPQCFGRDTHRALTTRPTGAGCPRCDVRGARDDLGLYQTHRLDMLR